MFSKYPITEVASLLSDPGRVAMLTALLDGASRPAGELARMASLSPQAASAHLAKLTTAQMLIRVREGRHHYYRIAKPEVGLALEALAAVSPPTKPTPVLEDATARALRFARTCYDHLAGRLAVQMAEALLRRQFLRHGAQGFELTRSGSAFLESLGVSAMDLEKPRRAVARACLDWTERRHHLAGSAGAALLAVFCSNGWVVRRTDTRAVRVTSKGRQAIGNLLDLRFD